MNGTEEMRKYMDEHGHHICKIMNIEEWIEEHQNTIFRYWIYRRMFLPDELENKYSDESPFENNIASSGYIREVIHLPDGDLLIGFLSPSKDVTYCTLSEIRLWINPRDNSSLWGGHEDDLELEERDEANY